MAEFTVTPEKTNQLHLSVHYAEGEEDGTKFELGGTLGLGGYLLILQVSRDGKQVARELIDVRPLVHQWIDSVKEALD